MSDVTRWIRSPAWDGVWMFSGLWAPALMGVGYFALWGATGTQLPAAWRLQGEIEFFYLFLGLGVLHRMTTTYAVLTTPILEEGIRREPGRYLYVPAAILVGCLLLAQAFAFHAELAFTSSPGGQLWAFFLLAYVMVIWERWHFCMQEFGVLSIYRVRAQQSSQRDRSFDRLYVVVLMLAVNTILYACFGLGADRAVLFRGTPLTPDYRSEMLGPIAFGALVVGMLAVLVALIREFRHPQRSLPKMLFYLLVGSHTLILYCFPLALGLFFLTYIFHHWMVAVGLFNRITFQSYAETSRIAAARTYLVRVGPFFAGCVAFYLLLGPFDRAGNLLPLPDASTFTDLSSARKAGVGLATGLFFAFNFLHYYYDRCLYQLSDPLVRKSVAPLLLARAPAKG